MKTAYSKVHNTEVTIIHEYKDVSGRTLYYCTWPELDNETGGILMITGEKFREATGRDPIQDDLERCNCPDAGEIGHSQCGWNHKQNVPQFMARPEN